MLLSRVAETIYWMQRYRERAENTARLLEVNLHLSTDAPKEIGNQWVPMIQTTGVEDLFEKRYKTVNERNVIRFLTFESENPNSILNCLRLSRENARSVREVIARDIWEELNTAYLFCNQQASTKKAVPITQLFARIKRQCQLVTAVADTCMLRTEAWSFGRLGNLIERADMTTRILDAKYFMLLPSPDKVGSPFDNIQWRALLKSASALENYQQSRHSIHAEDVVEFLILNPDFPRSTVSCLIRAEQTLQELLIDEKELEEKHPLKKTHALFKELQALDGAKIIDLGLHEFIDDVQLKLMDIDREIFNYYFSLETPRKILAYENI